MPAICDLQLPDPVCTLLWTYAQIFQARYRDSRPDRSTDCRLEDQERSCSARLENLASAECESSMQGVRMQRVAQAASRSHVSSCDRWNVRNGNTPSSNRQHRQNVLNVR